MKGFPTQDQVEYIKKQYPIGTRIKLIGMNDPYAPVPPGTMGTIDMIDSAGTLHMRWDNGRTLGVVIGEDNFKVISKPQEEQKMDSPKMGGFNL